MFSELVKNVMNLGIITEDDVRRLTAIELMLLIIERSNGLLEYLKSYIQSNDARVEQLDKKYQQITDEIKQRLIDNETYFNEVIREKVIRNIFNKFLKVKDKWFDFIDISFLPEEMKIAYKDIITNRLTLLN